MRARRAGGEGERPRGEAESDLVTMLACDRHSCEIHKRDEDRVGEVTYLLRFEAGSGDGVLDAARSRDGERERDGERGILAVSGCVDGALAAF